MSTTHGQYSLAWSSHDVVVLQVNCWARIWRGSGACWWAAYGSFEFDQPSNDVRTRQQLNYLYIKNLNSCSRLLWLYQVIRPQTILVDASVFNHKKWLLVHWFDPWIYVAINSSNITLFTSKQVFSFWILTSPTDFSRFRLNLQP